MAASFFRPGDRAWGFVSISLQSGHPAGLLPVEYMEGVLCSKHQLVLVNILTNTASRLLLATSDGDRRRPSQGH